MTVTGTIKPPFAHASLPASTRTTPAPRVDAAWALDAETDPWALLITMFQRPFISGTHPHHYAASIDAVKPDVPLHPAGSDLTRSITHFDTTWYLVEGSDWTLLVRRREDRGAFFFINSVTEELGRTVVDDLVAAVKADEEELHDDDNEIAMTYWFAGTSGVGASFRRFIDAPAWADIRGNYAPTAQVAFDNLMGLDPDSINGQLLLLHGQPGTGKTTALRALARAWGEWCTVEFVVDPDRMFADANYLVNAALGSGLDGWRLLLLEDCDELIRPDAKKSAGQALSRLLNLTDGMLGQGLRLLIGITTNEPLGNLHPAVVRPGRCLAELEVGALPEDAAAAWMRSNGVDPSKHDSGEKTLAELFALQHGAEV